MDDKVRRAEELLDQRSRERTNGESREASAEAPTAAEEGLARDDPARVALTNDLKRLAADFANYRKRNEAERAEFAKFAKADLIAKLLDVLDGYDRALATVPEELKGQPWVEGMRLVERKLRAILEAEGLEPVDSVGKPFDPYQHEAVAHVPSPDPEGTVIEEHQKAYRLHDRVIRPALVTVSSGGEKKERTNG
jgi:molecular chaperone GrpE